MTNPTPSPQAIRDDMPDAEINTDDTLEFPDPSKEESWHWHDEYDFWYIPMPNTAITTTREGCAWSCGERDRGFEPWKVFAPLNMPKTESQDDLYRREALAAMPKDSSKKTYLHSIYTWFCGYNHTIRRALQDKQNNRAPAPPADAITDAEIFRFAEESYIFVDHKNEETYAASPESIIKFARALLGKR